MKQNTYRFSQRTSWPTEENAVWKAVAELRRSGEKLIDCTLSNPTQCGWPAPPIDLCLPTRYAPEPLGSIKARQAVASYIQTHGGDVPPQNIWLASGTSELYAQLMAMTADAGDIWLIPRPGYPLFDYIADVSGIQLQSYPLLYDGCWRIDFGSLRQTLQSQPRVRALVTVSPHNPTGHTLSLSECQAMIELCLEFGIAWVVDEVFLDYPMQSEVTLPTCARFEQVLTFTVSGLSKVAALPQAKVAWSAVTGPDSEVREALRRAEWIGDTFLTLPAVIQHQVPMLLDQAPLRQREIQERCHINRVIATQLLRDTAVTPLNVTAGWSLPLRLPATHTDEEWALKLLNESRVLVQPGSWFQLDGTHVVMSLLTPPESFEAGIRAIALRGSNSHDDL